MQDGFTIRVLPNKTLRFCLFVMMIFYFKGSNAILLAANSNFSNVSGYSQSQKEPFYFLNPVPPKTRLFDKIDLSFFRNQLMVTQYRYRLEIPKGAIPDIDQSLMIWSGWTNNDFNEIKIPRIDQEGGYKLVIEYRPSAGSEVKSFVIPFYVYRTFTTPGTENVTRKAQPKSDIKVAQNQPPVTKVVPEKPATASVKTATTLSNTQVEKKRPSNKLMDLKDVRIDVNLTPKIAMQTVKIPTQTETIPETDNIPDSEIDTLGGNKLPDYDRLLTEAIERRDTLSINEYIQNGAGTNLKGKYGGNIFHLLNEVEPGRGMIAVLRDKGFSINETDDLGNSSLHYAVLAGRNSYARTLIDQGADMNIKNKDLLSPLHLAVFSRNEGAVKDLLKNGADVNLKGNTGYTPLHIASELNYNELVTDLMQYKARKSLRTDQGLSPKTIARIQKNQEILDLMRTKHNSVSDTSLTTAPARDINLNINGSLPNINFNLPYDKNLAKRRQFNKVVQIISIPVFVLSTSIFVNLRSKANHYYSMSKIAETEAMAKEYYDKANKYKKNSNIPGSISLVSLLSEIQSTMKKRTISKKMYKTF